jgi:hypothetical protein
MPLARPVVVVSLVGAPAQPALSLAYQLKTALQLQQTPRVLRQRGEVVDMVTLDGDDADTLQRSECVACTLFGVSVGVSVQQVARPVRQGALRKPSVIEAKAAAATPTANRTGETGADCDWSSEDDDWIPDAWRHIDCEEHARKANGGQPITLRG